MKKLILLLTFLPTLLFGQPTNLFNATNAIYLFGADKNGVPIVPTNTALVLATNKGSLIVGNGTNVIEFQKGSDGYYLMIDDTAETGLKWNSITMPEYSGEAKKLTINSQTLTGDKTLQCQVDEVCQVLNPNGVNRNITLTSPNRGDFFIIKNSGNSGLLTVKYSGNTISTVITNETKQFIYDSANWITITIDNLPTATLTNIYNDSKGWVGISNTTPQATFDVAGNIRASAGISLASTNRDLTGNFTLMVGGDNMYQFFNCNGADRTISLPSSATNGDMFFIKNITDSSLPYKLTIYDNKQSKTLDYLYSGKGKWYICNGTGWGSVDDYVVGETNMSSGYGAMAFTNGMAYGYQAQATNYGTAFGYQSSGNNSGAAVGYNANGANSGVAIGRESKGSDFGVAMGGYAKGSDFGAAMGYAANGTNSGAAVGYYANGSSIGAAMGYAANGSSYGAAMGYGANGADFGAAVGRGANGANSGAAVGYYANGSSIGAAMGYAANGTNSGAAMGYNANGADFGAAVGRGANGANSGAAMGYAANGTNSGAAVGRSANGSSYGAAVGYSAGYRQNNGKTNILIGYKAGYNDNINAITNGSYNLLIGRQTGVPNGDTSYYLNIGNAIFGTNVQTKTGTNVDTSTKIGIANNAPKYTLDVNGDVGLGTNGNLYKGGEKLGWYQEGTFNSSSSIIEITFPVTNAYYKIEAGFYAFSEQDNYIWIKIIYGASSYTKDGTVRELVYPSLSGFGANGSVQTSTIVFIETETERVNYWKIEMNFSYASSVTGNYILTRIR